MAVEILRKLSDRPSGPASFLVGVRGGKGLVYETIPDAASPPYLPCVGIFHMFGDKPFALEVAPTKDTVPTLVSTGPVDRSTILSPEPTISRQLLDVKALSEKEIAVISPVLELMQTGFYHVSLVSHWPTVGDEFLFWEAFGKNCRPPALSQGSDPRDGLFLFPTYSDSKTNENLVAKYEEGIASGRRPVGIALYHGGRLSLLLDGHHRAVAYTRLEQEVPCILIQHLKPAVRMEGQLRQAMIEVPGVGELFIDNLPSAAKLIAKEAIELGSGKRIIPKEVARSFVKATGVDLLLRTEVY